MKKILCPTDFSPEADQAVSYAAKLAQKTGSHLDLFNVQSLGDRTPDEAILGESMNAQLAYDRLDELSREVSRVFKISCNARVSTTLAGPSTMIEQEAGNHDLVVMGTNGPDSIYQSFFGSNSYRVARHTHTPVLILPSNVVYSEIKRIAFAFDYWRNNRLPLDQLRKLVQILDCELVILQILEPSSSAKANWEIREDQRMITERMGKEMALTFESLHTDHMADALTTFVNNNFVDVLVLCTQHQTFIERLFHKSLIKAMSKAATYPLLIVHA